MRVKVGTFLVVLLIAISVTATIVTANKSTTEKGKIDVSEIKENYAFIVRDFSKGVSIEEVEKIRHDYVNKVKTKHPERVVAFAVPEIPKGAKIVAYGIKIDKNGFIRQYFGLAGDGDSAKTIYKKAQKWYQKNILSEDLSTKTSAGWIEIGRNDADYYVSPYGGVTNNFELRQLTNDGTSSYDWFAIKHIFAMEPGYQAYNSEWRNDRGYPTHDYSVCILNPQLHDWDPIGSHTGQQTITVSITGGTEGASATWSWSYTQPDVTTLDHSSTNTEIAKWIMQFNNSRSLFGGGTNIIH